MAFRSIGRTTWQGLVLAVALVTSVMVGCGSDQDGGDNGDVARADAAALADAAILADVAPLADATACAPEACECFLNDDCPMGYACVSHDEGVTVYCELGERGTGEVGAPCEDETDCASGLCWKNGQNVGHCSARCSQPEDCPPEVPTCFQISGGGVDEMICADLT